MQPLLIIKNKVSDADRKQFEQELAKMGQSAWILLPDDCKVEFAPMNVTDTTIINAHPQR